METSLLDIIGDVKIEEESVSGTIKIFSRLSHWIQLDKISADGALDLQISPAGTLSALAFDVHSEMTDITIERQGRDRVIHHEISELISDFSWHNEKIYIHHIEWPWAGGVFLMNGFAVPETKELALNLNTQGTNCYEFFQDLDMSDAPWVEMGFV